MGAGEGKTEDAGQEAATDGKGEGGGGERAEERRGGKDKTKGGPVGPSEERGKQRIKKDLRTKRVNASRSNMKREGQIGNNNKNG